MSDLFDNKSNGGNGNESWRQIWDEVTAAQQYDALPSGLYEAEPTKREMFKAKSGTPGLKVTWRVVAGECEGRRVWQDLWLSAKALPYTKRVLAELRMTSPDDPLPDGVICAVQVAKQQNDQGTAYNEVKRVKFLRVEENPFSPAALANTTAAPTMLANTTSTPTTGPQPVKEMAVDEAFFFDLRNYHAAKARREAREKAAREQGGAADATA